MKSLLIIVLSFCFSVVHADSHNTSHFLAKEISPMCLESERITKTQKEGDFLQAGICIGYILAVIDDEYFRVNAFGSKDYFVSLIQRKEQS